MKLFYIIPFVLAIPMCTTAQLQKLGSFGLDNKNQSSFALKNEVVYFQSQSAQLSAYLRNSVWVSDGTPNGTRKILADVFIRDQGVQHGDTIFFVTDDAFNNRNLMSYSTSGGLRKLKYFEGEAITNVRNFSNLLISEDKLFFSVYEGNKNWIWKSDGSVSGTVMLPFDFNSTGYEGIELQVNPYAGLVVTVKTSGNPIVWSYDETTNDTTYLRNFVNMSSGYYALLNGISYFSHTDDQHGWELWRSDGTPAGTYLFVDIDPRTYYDTYNNKTIPLSTYPHRLFAFDGYIYFVIWKNTSSPYDNSVEELWRTDGTPGGTVQVKASLNEWGRFDRFTVFSNYFVFAYDDLVHGNEWWYSDGSASGTNLLKELHQGPASTFTYYDSFVSTGSEIFFSGNDGKIGNELWKFDGASKTVKQLADILQGPNSSHPKALQKFGNTLFAIANDGLEDASLFSINLSTTQVSDPDATPLLPATQWFQTIGHEFAVSGFNLSSYYNYDLGVDSKNNIYLTGQFNNNKTIFYDNNTITSLPFYVQNANQVSKFGPDGLLKWQKVLHTHNAPTLYYNGPMLSTLSDNDVVVASSFPSSASNPWTNYMGLPALNRNGLYVTRIHENGSILWAKYLLGASYQPYVHAVKTDADGNIYVAGLYYDGLYWQDELLLNYEYTPTYFLLKFDHNGNLLMAHDLATQWGNYGEIAELKIDDERHRIYLLITEGTRNESSSCEYQKWHFALIESDFDGNLIRSKEVESSDFMIASSFDYNSVHDFYITGTFRGTLSSDGYKETTPSEGACSSTRSFIVQLDSEWKTVTIKSGENDPHELKFLSNDTYVLSGTNGNEIFIHQFDPLNNLLGQKIFKKDPDIANSIFTNDFLYSNPILRFDNGGNFILSDRYTNSMDSIANGISGQALKTFILKAPYTEIEPIPFVKGDQYPIDFYPNPAKDRLNIKIHEQQKQKFSLQIIDAIGRVVDTPQLNNEQEIYYVDVTPYASGLYFFVFDNGAQHITRKIIVAH
jgi:ELWxxDGT repeat protein